MIKIIEKNKKIIETIILLSITIGGFSSLIINTCGLINTYPYNIIGWGSLILVVLATILTLIMLSIDYDSYNTR
jgi:hypothetical protein